MSNRFLKRGNQPHTPDGDGPPSRGGQALRLPALNWIQTSLLAAFALIVIAWMTEPTRENEESPVWSSPTRHPRGSLWTLSFAPDGRSLVSGGNDGALVLWETGKGIKADLSSDSLGIVHCAAFSVDGSTLAVGHGDSSLSLWDVNTGKRRATFTGHSAAVRSLAFSRDGKTLAAGDDGPSIRVWDLPSARTKTTLLGHRGSVCVLSFAPDGLLLASGCSGGMVKLWDLTTAVSRQWAGPNGDNRPIPGLSFSLNGETLASGGNCEGLRLWDVVTGRELPTIKHESSCIREVKFSSDGSKLIEVRQDGVVVLWDISTWRKSTFNTRHSFSYCSTVSADGRLLAMGCDDGTIKIWDLANAVIESFEHTHSDR
jgi:WD40 repeat protein